MLIIPTNADVLSVDALVRSQVLNGHIDGRCVGEVSETAVVGGGRDICVALIAKVRTSHPHIIVPDCEVSSIVSILGV